ncbi:HAD family hydrolase [Pseudomonadota bacterium]
MSLIRPPMVPTTRPRAIIFDWDNTLIDSWVVIQDALNATFDVFGLDRWTLDETKVRVAKSMRDSFPALFGDEWERAGEVFYGHFEAMHLDRLTPLPGAHDAVAQFAEAGFYMGVVSNKTGKLLRAEAEKLGWNGYFGQIVGAQDAPRDKPAPDPVTMALDGSGVQAGTDVWFAGDAAVDLECAKNAGCIGVLVRPEPPLNGEFHDMEPALHVDTVQKLFNLAKNL